MSALRHNNILCVPSFHNRIAFAQAVRESFKTFKPDIVALELPDIYLSDYIQGLERLPKLSLLCIHQHDDAYAYLPIYPSDSMVEGARLARANKIPIALIDLAVQDYEHIQDFALPDSEAVNILGLETFYQEVAPYLPKQEANDLRREEHMAAHLLSLSQSYEKVLFICGLQHWPNILQHLKKEKASFHSHSLDGVEAPFLAKLGPKARYTLLEEMPYLVMHYELSRRFGLPYERAEHIRQLLQETREAPLLSEMEIAPRELLNILRYGYKLVRRDKRVGMDLYNLLLASKQTLGDDFAIEVMDRALHYPYTDDEDLPEIEFDPNEEGFFLEGRKITLRRNLLPLLDASERHWIQLEIKKKKVAELEDDFQPYWFFFGFFSHIPEDLILEGFIDRLQDKLASETRQREVKIEEFRGSLLDGIDMRETIRHHSQNKLFVKSFQDRRAAIGTWILIFDEDLSEEKYPWMLSLSAEHHNESDILFYATHPAMHPVTQNIIRAEYGALLAFKPPLEISCDQEELEIDGELRKEQLIRLAIEHSPRPGILYFAAHPPEEYLVEQARQKGKVLYHLPLSRISKRNLKKIQRFHLLSDRSIRDIADDYI